MRLFRNFSIIIAINFSTVEKKVKSLFFLLDKWPIWMLDQQHHSLCNGKCSTVIKVSKTRLIMDVFFL